MNIHRAGLHGMHLGHEHDALRPSYGSFTNLTYVIKI